MKLGIIGKWTLKKTTKILTFNHVIINYNAPKNSGVTECVVMAGPKK